jgi:hypothetical protein
MQEHPWSPGLICLPMNSWDYESDAHYVHFHTPITTAALVLSGVVNGERYIPSLLMSWCRHSGEVKSYIWKNKTVRVPPKHSLFPETTQSHGFSFCPLTTLLQHPPHGFQSQAIYNFPRFYPAGRPHLTALRSGHGNQHLAGVFLARPSTSPNAKQYVSHFKVF